MGTCVPATWSYLIPSAQNWMDPKNKERETWPPAAPKKINKSAAYLCSSSVCDQNAPCSLYHEWVLCKALLPTGTNCCTWQSVKEKTIFIVVIFTLSRFTMFLTYIHEIQGEIHVQNSVLSDKIGYLKKACLSFR